MSIESGQAVLTSSFNIEIITGFRYFQDGVIDELSNSVKAIGTSRWSNLSTWGAYKDWITSRQPIRWTAPLIDIGSVRYFTISVATEFQGTPSHFDIAVSDTGAFAGEETIYKILEGNTNVSAFYGRYVYVSFTVNGPELSRMTVTTSTQTSEIKFTNVDTSTLAGNASARQLPITNPISQVVNMDIKVIASSSYNMDVYVTDTPTSTTLVPMVVNKSGTTPTFRLVGLDNQPRNGLVDITIEALPRQAVVGGNMVVIA